jgi:ubiquinone/menaquinone biosynthesis C-methylase UbiE
MSETSVATVEADTDPLPSAVGTMYDNLEHDTLHFGYWTSDTDGNSLGEASDHLTDLVLDRLGVVGGERILDVGCGMGTPALKLASTVEVSIVGVTISGRQVERATQRAQQCGFAERLEFQLADAMALPFPDDSFDAAFALESVQHMDRATVLRELVRVVRPGGKIVLTDLFRRARPSEGGPSIMDALVSMWMMTEPLALADYPDLLAASGLRLVELTDITDNVLHRSFAAVLQLIVGAVDAGSLPSHEELDVTVPANQQAVIQFAEQMTHTDEVGYLVLVAGVPE